MDSQAPGEQATALLFSHLTQHRRGAGPFSVFEGVDEEPREYELDDFASLYGQMIYVRNRASVHNTTRVVTAAEAATAKMRVEWMRRAKKQEVEDADAAAAADTAAAGAAVHARRRRLLVDEVDDDTNTGTDTTDVSDSDADANLLGVSASPSASSSSASSSRVGYVKKLATADDDERRGRGKRSLLWSFCKVPAALTAKIKIISTLSDDVYECSLGKLVVERLLASPPFVLPSPVHDYMQMMVGQINDLFFQVGFTRSRSCHSLHSLFIALYTFVPYQVGLITLAF
jgi:hypothetical protein